MGLLAAGPNEPEIKLKDQKLQLGYTMVGNQRLDYQ